ncbi:MAG: hypothetical protein D9V47_02360 [Clostridia bacterium]|nr:MAG: hypothetical protein D9V47_02360 [Clostridia bacterium]
MRHIYVVGRPGKFFLRQAFLFAMVAIVAFAAWGLARQVAFPFLREMLVRPGVQAWLVSWEFPGLASGQEILPARLGAEEVLDSQLAVVQVLGRRQSQVARGEEPERKLPYGQVDGQVEPVLGQGIPPFPGEPQGSGTGSGLPGRTGEDPEVPELHRDGSAAPANGEPQVFIYTTHNAETYIPTAGVAKEEGQNAGITEVAAELAHELEGTYGVTVAFSRTIHDYPDFSGSYGNSARTVSQALAAYPHLRLIVDVHRDAGIGAESFTWQGQNVAKVLLVVGSEHTLPHPRWRENLALANHIKETMAAFYPGMSRGVRVQHGRYNQHLSPQAILVEVGTAENSLEEAKRAARLLAHVLAEVVTHED